MILEVAKGSSMFYMIIVEEFPMIALNYTLLAMSFVSSNLIVIKLRATSHSAT